jgi:fructokinase
MRTICFGEALWDLLPTGKFPGGAPLNVAYHLSHLGVAPHVVSSVGRDALGTQLVSQLREWGFDTDGIGVREDLPTGTVVVSATPQRDPAYSIAGPVAWDRISPSPATAQVLQGADALIFGSLAQRSAANRAAFAQLLEGLPPRAVRAFDVNLRPPHDDLDLVRALAHGATMIKLNSGEAARLAAACPSPRAAACTDDDEACARVIAAECAGSGANGPVVCVTAAERGAGLLCAGRWFREHGRPSRGGDAVGAGDAFFAALVAGFLRGEPPEACLVAACRHGEWVASCVGATPAYPAAGERASRHDVSRGSRP